MIGAGLVILCILGYVLYGANMARKSFRRMLPGELEHWLDDGIIDKTQAEQLRTRYRLDQLAQESQNVLIKTIFGFGSVLIALGVIAFVAAHWESITKMGRLSLVVGAMLIAYGIGFWFWRKRPESPLGHILVILATLIFGANIALVAQIFHLSGEFYNAVFLWAIGATFMGYIAGSSPLLILAILATFVGYMGWAQDYIQAFPVHFLAAPLVFLPFAYLKKARGVHFATWLFWGIGLIAYLVPWEGKGSPMWLVFIAEAMILLFWSYGQLRFIPEEFSSDLRFLGILSQIIFVYILSFHDLVEEIVAQPVPVLNDWRLFIFVVLGIAILFARFAKARQGVTEERISEGVFWAISLIMAAIPWLQGSWAMPVGTLIANLATVILGVMLFWKGLTILDRRYFWMGLILLVLEVVGRFFEYEAGLLWKSAAFIFAGLVLMAGGVLFEKRRGREMRHEA